MIEEARETEFSPVPGDESSGGQPAGDVSRGHHDRHDKKECRDCRKLQDRIHHLEKDIEKMKSEIAQLDDSYRRKVADFDNYRKRIQKMMEDASLESSRKMVSQLLPVMDNFGRAVSHSREHKDFEALYAGLKISLDEILRVFENWGVRPFDSVGAEFDPNLHEALLMEDREDVPFDKTVVEEIEKGYRMGDFVIRHSKVKVGRKQDAGGAAADRPASS